MGTVKIALKPTEILRDMVKRLSLAAEGLFTAPPVQFVSREKGTYAYLIGKLSKRLSATLSVDREVLILFSSFEDQQQRTIKIARELIKESTGRYEVCGGSFFLDFPMPLAKR